MPTIEIHGIPTGEAQRAFESRIIEAVRSASYADDVVVAHGHLVVLDLRQTPRPFLRIWLTFKMRQHEADIIERLKTVELDLEIAELRNYIPAS